MTAYFIAVFGLVIGIVEYRFITQGLASKYWFMHLIIPAYILVSISAFLGPLVSAHLKMKEFKHRYLREVSMQLQSEYENAYNSMEKPSNSIGESIEKINALETFYQKLNRFPVWPFDIEILRKYLISNGFPLFPPILALLQNFMSNVLNQLNVFP